MNFEELKREQMSTIDEDIISDKMNSILIDIDNGKKPSELEIKVIGLAGRISLLQDVNRAIRELEYLRKAVDGVRINNLSDDEVLKRFDIMEAIQKEIDMIKPKMEKAA